MRRSSIGASIAACLALVLAVALADTVSAAHAASASSTASVAGNVEPELDATPPGRVGAAAFGAAEGGVVPVIVRNATNHPVARVTIRARAVDRNGRTLARAATGTVVPAPLAPGALGLARIDFGDPSLPATATYDFRVTGRRAAAPRTVPLDVTAFRLSPPIGGAVAQSLDVTVRNPVDTPLRGPLRVGVMCFGESRRPVRFVTKTSPQRALAAQSSATITVNLPALCPTYLVGATAARRS